MSNSCVIRLTDIVKHLEIQVTDKVYEANLVTHDGTFHADEVVASVIAALYLKITKGLDIVKLCRTSDVPPNLNPNVIVYDIGGGRFDHHNVKNAKVRKNGVPYAAAGLIWREFGDELTKNTPNPKSIWFEVEGKMIRGIDAVDNGTMPIIDYPAIQMSVSNVISSFNPNWDDDRNPDEAFLEAIDYAGKIFDNIIRRAISKENARQAVEREIENTEGEIMVMDKFYPWTSHLLFSENSKAENINIVVYPSKRGGYELHTVPKGKARELRNIPRVPLPEKWRGLRTEELQRETGISTAIFCHLAGISGSAETLEDTIAMAKLAIASEKIIS